MAKLWKGLRGIVKKDDKYSTDLAYSVFSKEMTLKLVFVGGHQSGKTSIVRILNKQKFTAQTEPTIGIDQHKIKMEHTEAKETLWIWDVSHAELGGVHESLIFHQAHGIVLVADLTNFTSIQAIDQWLHSISVHLKRVYEAHQQMDMNGDSDIDHATEDDHEDAKKDETHNTDTTHNNHGMNDTSRTSSSSTHRRRRAHRVLLPRLYLLTSKYDLSEEPILTDAQLRKFCKSNSIRAFARISAKLDRRSEMIEILGTFSEDIIDHLPSDVPYHILQEENDRHRYNYAQRRWQRNKIQATLQQRSSTGDGADGTAADAVFDLRSHAIQTFTWHTSSQAVDTSETGRRVDYNDNDDDGEDEEKKQKSELRRKSTSRNTPLQLRHVEQHAKRVLSGMRECVRLESARTIRDGREYQKNLLKLKAMHQSTKAAEQSAPNNMNQSRIIDVSLSAAAVQDNTQKQPLLQHDVITALKLEMIRALQQEIEQVTVCWENELNTILELIRFRIPRQRINANLHTLSQRIMAKEMLFKRRIRLVSELRTHDRCNVHQMLMYKQEFNESMNIQTQPHPIAMTRSMMTPSSSSVSVAKSKSLLPSLVDKNDSVEALP